jgi:hypothetical protein
MGGKMLMDDPAIRSNALRNSVLSVDPMFRDLIFLPLPQGTTEPPIGYRG